MAQPNCELCKKEKEEYFRDFRHRLQREQIAAQQIAEDEALARQFERDEAAEGDCRFDETTNKICVGRCPGQNESCEYNNFACGCEEEDDDSDDDSDVEVGEGWDAGGGDSRLNSSEYDTSRKECTDAELVANTDRWIAECKKNMSHLGDRDTPEELRLKLAPGWDRSKWILCTSPGDGHCFYWTLLRFLRAYKLERNLTDRKPEIKAIAALREAVLEEARDENKLRKSLGRPQKRLTGMQEGLEDAQKGLATQFGGWADDFDFDMASKRFNICIVVWNPGNRGEFWSSSGGLDLTAANIHNDSLVSMRLDNVNCKHIMFAINSGGQHFDSLIPNERWVNKHCPSSFSAVISAKKPSKENATFLGDLKQQEVQQFWDMKLRDKLIDQFLEFNIEYDGAKSIEDLEMELDAAKAAKGREQKMQSPADDDEEEREDSIEDDDDSGDDVQEEEEEDWSDDEGDWSGFEDVNFDGDSDFFNV